MVDIKNLYLGAFDDIPFVSIEDLKKGQVVETTYYSETPFLCLSEVGGALLKALEKCQIKIERARVDLDKKEPMNVYMITMKTPNVEIKYTTGKYLSPGRDKRPPRTENKGIFPWGYFVKLDMSGQEEEAYLILSELLVTLKREPWDGLFLDEFTVETGVWEDVLKDGWISSLSPILDEFEKKIAEARRIKVDTKEVETYLKDARKALEDRKLSYLIHLVTKMDFEEIDRHLKEERDKGHELSQRIVELQNVIKEAKSLGLDTVTVEHYLRTSKKNMFEQNWDAAYHDVNKAEDIVKVLKRMSRPQLKLTLNYPDRFLVEEENILGLHLENVGNVPAAKIDAKIQGDVAIGSITFPEVLDREGEIDIPAAIYSEQGGLKSLKIEIEYFREYDDQRYTEEKDIELFFVDRELKLDAKSEVEFQAGFIRVDMEILNNYVTEVTELEVELVIKDAKAELVSMDPRASAVERRIQFGNIPRGGALGTSFFLDTLYNENVSLKFEINFKDAKGKKKFFVHPLEPVTVLKTKAVVGEIPSAKALIEKMASTHNKYFGKIYEIPVSTKPEDCYQALRNTIYALPGAMVWEGDAEVVKMTRGRKGKGSEATDKVNESWFTIQDQDPGHSAGLHIRVYEGTDSAEISVAANDMHYGYSVLLQIQELFIKELVTRKHMPEGALLKQIKNPWLRQRIRGRETTFLKIRDVEDVDLEKKIARAAKERDDKFASLREKELKAYKYKAWSGAKR